MLKYFEYNKNINKVILFGSRAKGNERINSDIDICIDAYKIERGTIVNDINEIIGVYSCDIVFYDSLNKEISDQINRYGIIIYTKENKI